MKNLKLLTLIFCLSISQLIQAQDQVEAQITKEIELKIQLSRLVLESGERIDNEIAKTYGLNESIFDNEGKLSKILANEVVHYEQFYEKALNIPEEKIPLFRKIFAQIHWKNIIPLMKKAHIGAEIFFKKKGYGIGIAVMMSKTTKFTLLSSLVKLGLSQFTPVVMMIPWTALYSIVPKMIEKYKIQHILVETLGSKEKVNAFEKQEVAMLAQLNLKSPDDLILPIRDLPENQVEGVIIRNNPIWKKLLAYINVNTDDLNIFTLKDFLRESRVQSPYIDWVLKRKGLDNDQKMVLVIAHLFSSEDEKVVLQFRSMFSNHFVISKPNASWETILNWSRKMREKKTMEEVIEETKRMPKDLKPKEIALIWENILLPEYIKTLDIDHGEARTMITQFEAFKGRMYALENPNFDLVQHEVFTFIEKILRGKQFNGCSKSAKEVELLLLRRN